MSACEVKGREKPRKDPSARGGALGASRLDAGSERPSSLPGACAPVTLHREWRDGQALALVFPPPQKKVRPPPALGAALDPLPEPAARTGHEPKQIALLRTFRSRAGRSCLGR